MNMSLDPVRYELPPEGITLLCYIVRRMYKTEWLAKASALLALLLAFPSSASAHRPVWGEDQGITPIDSLSTSFAFYRELEADQIHVFSFEGKKGQTLHAGIQIPAIAGFENYAVSMAIFGPSFPKPKETQLPPNHPEDLGALIFPTQIGSDFFEPFTQTRYWGRQKADLILPADGEYYIVVWNPEGKPGKYVMDSGSAEVFSPRDLFLFPIWWMRVHIFFGHGAQLALAGSGIIAVIAGLFIRRQRSIRE
jgi:hypothetical protein